MSQNSNLIGLARTALPNGGKIFVTPVAASEGGVVSFRVYTSKVSDSGEVSLRDITRLSRVLRAQTSSIGVVPVMTRLSAPRQTGVSSLLRSWDGRSQARSTVTMVRSPFRLCEPLGGVLV